MSGGSCRRAGTNQERAWALAKEDALAYRDNWRGAARYPVQALQSKCFCIPLQFAYVPVEFKIQIF